MPTDPAQWEPAVQSDGATLLNDDERQGLRPAWIATRGDLDIAESLNIEKALRQRRWAKLTTAELLDDLVLRRLHRAMFGDVWSWAGRYRVTEKNIGADPRMVSVDVRKLVDDAAYWFQATSMTIDEAATKFHRDLVAIHPFPNGNGRHARAATDLLLSSLNVPAFTWGGGRLTVASETRNAYITALRTADAGDYGPLLTFARS
jgi:Fic-DOC domain mobile mystery protein B